MTGTNKGTVTDLSDMAGEYPYTFQLGDGEDDTGLDGHDGVSGRGWLFQDGKEMKASDWLFTVHEPVEPPKPTGEIIGHECIHEGDTESYKVKLDSFVTEDTYVTINIDNGTAKQSDGMYQSETIKSLSNPYTYNVELGEQGQLYSANLHDRTQAARYWNGTHWFEGDLNQLPIGADNLMDDFVVMPNHVHLLAVFRDGESMGKQCASWMRYTATKINRSRGVTGSLWQSEPFDHLVRSEVQLNYLRDYIAMNPRKAGLGPNDYLYRRSERQF